MPLLFTLILCSTVSVIELFFAPVVCCCPYIPLFLCC
jgi:hypothetical protein